MYLKLVTLHNPEKRCMSGISSWISHIGYCQGYPTHMSGTSPNTNKGYLIGYPSQQNGMGYPCCIQGISCTLVIGYHRGYPIQGILTGILTGISKCRGYPYQYPQKDILCQNRDIPTLLGISPQKWLYPFGQPSRCQSLIFLRWLGSWTSSKRSVGCCCPTRLHNW